MQLSSKWKYRLGVYRRHDLPAGLTVFLVALPLCLGIALASGAPLQAGIISGIIGGVIVALASDSALGVSGPAAGLTTIVAAVVAHYTYPQFMAIIILAGIFQLAMGVLKLGQIAGYFPSSVIKGMLAAIGIILIIKQFPIAIGYNQPDFWSNELYNLFSDRHLFSNLKEFTSQLSYGALIITLLSLWAYYIVEKKILLRIQILPVPLFVVTAAIALAFLFKQFVPALALTDSQLVHIPPALFTSFQLPDFSLFTSAQWLNALKYAVFIAFMASLETLLCVEAIDKLDPWHRTTPANRELLAQGLGNMLCGFMGALPITAVIVRGSANIDAGGRTKAASFTHGVLLLAAALLIPFALNYIPLCALASILVVTGFKLTKPKLHISMWKAGWNQFLPFIVTIIVILLTDLFIGVSIGLVFSIFFILRNNYKAEFEVKQETFRGITTYTVLLHTNVTFMDKAKLRAALDKIPDYSVVVLDGSIAKHIDHDVLEMISEYCINAKRRGIEVQLNKVARVSISEIH
ncbi:MAG: SulP family inorganic anion transporter [Chitinophagales bacterium]